MEIGDQREEKSVRTTNAESRLCEFCYSMGTLREKLQREKPPPGPNCLRVLILFWLGMALFTTG